MASLRATRKIWEVSYGSEEGLPSVDPRGFFFIMAPEFIRQARSTRAREAVSYRDTLVGGTAQVTNPNRFSSRAYIGFNNTPYKGAPKHCAEMRAIGRGMQDGYTQQEAIVVAGPTDPDVIKSIIGKVTSTLPPCAPCSGIIQESALVLTIGETDNIAQAWTGNQIKQLYKPVGLVGRRKREEALAKKPSPQQFEIPVDHTAEFWANAAEEYAGKAALILAQYPEEQRLENMYDIRLAQAVAAVDSLYVAAA